MGIETMHAGEIIVIPKGISHCFMLSDDSEGQNILLELKILDQLTYVATGARHTMRRDCKCPKTYPAVGRWKSW